MVRDGPAASAASAVSCRGCFAWGHRLLACVRLHRNPVLGDASMDVGLLSGPANMRCFALQPFGVVTPRPFALQPP